MKANPPWSDPEVLAPVLAGWRERHGGRELFRVSAGDRWVRLHLAGEDRTSLLLTDLPGARLVCSHQGRLPGPVAESLTPQRKHPLPALLNGARLVTCGLLPKDRVVAFQFTDSQGNDLILLHQLFGARGNVTVLDRSGKLLWSLHRPPHAALAVWPPRGTWTGGEGSSAPPDYDTQALTRIIDVCTEQAHTVQRAALNRRQKASTRLLGNLGRDLANADQGDIHRHKAETLAAHLHTLTQGSDQAVLPNLTTGETLTIALDPSRTPAANMEAWFRRARKAEKGLDIIRARHLEATAESERLQAAHDGLVAALASEQPLERLAALQQWRTDHADLMPSIKARPGGRTAVEPARPFRRYLVDGKWEVWVGRNNKENDELTHRAAHNRDLWLHAQGVSGSHVIVRAGGHPERISAQVIAKAASLAALHSKARHSKLVPVIHTEKRYVRKPRKAPVGTAVCLRDQSLFVEPGVMPGVEPA